MTDGEADSGSLYKGSRTDYAETTDEPDGSGCAGEPRGRERPGLRRGL